LVPSSWKNINGRKLDEKRLAWSLHLCSLPKEPRYNATPLLGMLLLYNSLGICLQRNEQPDKMAFIFKSLLGALGKILPRLPSWKINL
jgi:hypothetical protein